MCYKTGQFYLLLTTGTFILKNRERQSIMMHLIDILNTKECGGKIPMK